jgi:hypothetical protein
MSALRVSSSACFSVGILAKKRWRIETPPAKSAHLKQLKKRRSINAGNSSESRGAAASCWQAMAATVRHCLSETCSLCEYSSRKKKSALASSGAGAVKLFSKTLFAASARSAAICGKRSLSCLKMAGW